MALSAETATATAIDLTWSAGDDPEAFEIERVMGADTSVIVVAGNARSRTDSGLDPDALYQYRIRACDGDLCSEYSGSATARTFELLVVTTSSLPGAMLGEPYSEEVTASGGDGEYSWEVVGGALPSGLSLSEAGLVSGTPDAAESATFTLRARSGDGQTAEETYTIEVVDPVPPAPTDVVVQSASASGVVLTWAAAEDPGSFQVQRASGGGAFGDPETVAGEVRSYTDDDIEAGESYQYRVRSCDGDLCSEYAGPAVAEIPTTLEIETPSLPDAAVGAAYSESVIATGGAGVYTWAVVAGSLPAGLSLGQAQSGDALISGTPEHEETATFTLRVESEDGQSVEAEFTIEVVTPSALVIETVALPPVVVGGSYQVRLEATGGPDPEHAWSVASGTLPDGLSIQGDEIQGFPTTAETAEFTLRVTSRGITATRGFTIQVTPDDTSRFDITPFPVVAVPPGIQPHVDEAIARWEEAITGDLEAAALPAGFLDANDCAGFGDLVNGTSTDDVIMIINIAPIDGPGSVLGRAGPCAIRLSNGLPIAGALTLDSDDLEGMTGSNTLTSVLFHEMGHVLGFGTLWRLFDLTEHAGTDSTSFVGPNAVAEYQNLGGTGDVPLANTGGSGTRDSHWREAVFDREVLTGFSEPVGVDQPFSRMSIASMADLGYTVDLGAADPFSLGAALMATADHGSLGHDVALLTTVKVVDERGRVRTIDLREPVPLRR